MLEGLRIWPVLGLSTGDGWKHVTVLRRLHWLPVKQRVDYNLATLVYKSLRGQAPSYLVDDCQPVSYTHLTLPTIYSV